MSFRVCQWNFVAAFGAYPRWRPAVAFTVVVIAVVAAVMLTGCNFGPTYKRPELAVPPDWQEHVHPEAAHWPAADWWQDFRSPELNAYIAQAKRANNDLLAAIARVHQADALVTEAGAALLPTVGANFSALSERELATNSTYANFREYSPQLTVSYMLDFWGKNRAAQDAAIATATASRHDQETVELTVITGVASTYFQSVALRNRVAIAENNLASAETILKGLRKQLAAGIATALDVAQQETVAASLAAVVPPLRQQLRQTLDALAILTGQTPESIALGATAPALIELAIPTVSPGLPSELLNRRPDVAEAEAQLISANANIAVARAAFFPSIQLTASTGYASPALSTLIRSASSVHTLAADVVQPIFDGGVLKGQYAFAKARYDELAADYRKAVLTAFGNVEDALAGWQQTTEQVRRLEIAVDKAGRAHRIAQAQLHSGTVNILTVLNTESALFSAQDALIQAKLNQMQAAVGLFGALGGGWQKESAHEG
jgi:NodT family efflux transporter outer membrane factor (OMF) lipoprotein